MKKMKKILGMIITGTMVTAMLTACGGKTADIPDTSAQTTETRVQAPAESGSKTASTSSTHTGTESAKTESTSNESVFDQKKVPVLTKQQKYIRDDKNAKKAGFLLASDEYADAPNIFIGIDIPGSNDMHISMNTDLNGLVWETSDGALEGLQCTSEGLYFKVPDAKDTIQYGGNVSLSFRNPVYEGTKEKLTSINDKAVLYQDGGYVVTDNGDGRSILQYVYHVYDYDVYGKYYLNSLYLQYLDSADKAKDTIKKYREILTIGYIEGEDSAPIGEDGKAIDLAQYRDFRDIEMEELDKYGIYLDDASHINNQASISIPGADYSKVFSGTVNIINFADAKKDSATINFAGNKWSVAKKDGYINVWTGLGGDNALEITIYETSLASKGMESMTDKEVEKMLSTVFSPDKAN